MKNYSEPKVGQPPAAISRKAGMLNITVDPRLELLAVLQKISGSKMVCQGENSYADAIEAWFAPFKEHPVCDLLKRLGETDYNHDLPVSSFLRFEDISCSKIAFNWEPYSEAMNLRRLESVSEVVPPSEFYAMVGEFAIQSDFAGFFASQTDFYQKRVEDAVWALSEYPDMIMHMISWYGYSQASYTMAISPLVLGGYGLAMMDAAGGVHAYAVMNQNCQHFTKNDLRELSIWFFHEFSHSFVNPLVDRYWEIFKRGERFYELIQGKMIRQSYGNWWIAVVEHFVRTNDHRLSELYFGLDKKAVLPSEIGMGFIFIEQAYEATMRYEESRAQSGIGYDEYFPELARQFMQIEDIPEDELRQFEEFSGPINGVSFRDDILIIYPDPDRVEGVKKHILPTVKWLVQALDAQAVTDSEALEMDLKNRPLYLYGAWGTNLVLEKYKSIIPFEIDEDGIVADKLYKGRNLRIALCLRHPLNEKLGIVVYTAQNTRAMKNSNSFFHGPQDWYVSNADLEILGQGDFTQKGEVWRF